MLRLQTNDDGVATILIDRCEKKNALSADMILQATELFREVAETDAARAVVLTSTGADFCGGADLSAPRSGGIAGSLHRIQAINGMVAALASIHKPVIAAVKGACVGVGWSLALACDFVIAAADTRFQFAFRNVGLAPDGGAVFLLTRYTGLMRAKELVYSGRPVDGAEAAKLGLVLELTATESVSTRASEFAAELARAATLSLMMAKRQFDAASAATLQQTLALEEIMQPLMAVTEDFKEGVAAFRERRPPTFKGR